MIVEYMVDHEYTTIFDLEKQTNKKPEEWDLSNFA